MNSEWDNVSYYNYEESYGVCHWMCHCGWETSVMQLDGQSAVSVDWPEADPAGQSLTPRLLDSRLDRGNSLCLWVRRGRGGNELACRDSSFDQHGSAADTAHVTVYWPACWGDLKRTLYHRLITHRQCVAILTTRTTIGYTRNNSDMYILTFHILFECYKWT